MIMLRGTELPVIIVINTANKTGRSP